jgi:hypothetical protein
MVKERAVRDHDGKVSAYVRRVVERDLAGDISPTETLSPTVLVDLARQLGGELLARDLAEQLGDTDQPRELLALLRARATPHWSAADGVVGDLIRSLWEDARKRRLVGSSDAVGTAMAKTDIVAAQQKAGRKAARSKKAVG